MAIFGIHVRFLGCMLDWSVGLCWLDMVGLCWFWLVAVAGIQHTLVYRVVSTLNIPSFYIELLCNTNGTKSDGMILWLKDILLFSCHPCSGRKNMSLFSSQIIFPKMGKALAIEERTKVFVGDLGI